jgi:hypothetical protein
MSKHGLGFGGVGYLDVSSSIVAAPVRQRGEEWQAAAGSGEGRGDEREGVRRGWVGVTGSVGGHGGHGGICVPVRKYEP